MSVELADRPVASPTPAPLAKSSVATHALSTGVYDRLIPEWLALFERDAQASAWQHPRVVMAECRCLPLASREPLLIGCRREEELTGAAILLPKSIGTRQAGALGPGWNLNGYRLVGSRLMNAKRSATTDDELWRATLDAVSRQDADFLLIEDLDQCSPLTERLRDTLPAGWKAFVPNGWQARLRIRFPEDGHGYWDQFSKKTLATFRRKLKKFGATRLERITHADQVPDFLAKAHDISRQTWQSRRLGLRIRNSDAERSSLTALADAGLLRSYLWYSNGEPAAFCLGNQAHGVFNYEEVGYATRFARFSPGQMLIVQMINDLLDHDRPVWFDFGGGDADYKRMFANHLSDSGTVWLTPPTWKACVSLCWIQSGRTLTQTIRRTMATLGLATRVRQWIRYGGRPSPTGTEKRPAQTVAEEEEPT
jgi:CelD/BcsL family acetyltransferase involved in cellulose biosynthesis